MDKGGSLTASRSSIISLHYSRLTHTILSNAYSNLWHIKDVEQKKWRRENEKRMQEEFIDKVTFIMKLIHKILVSNIQYETKRLNK